MQTNAGASLLESTVVAALVAAFVSLTTLWLTSRRDRQDRQRKLFADAFEACILYREYPFIVRRRNAQDLVGERARITSSLSQLQARLNSHQAILRVEAPSVAEAYIRLVAATRGIAGPKISENWDLPALDADSDVHIKGIDYAQLRQFDDAYLNMVRDHLSLLPRRVNAWIRARRTASRKDKTPVN